MTTIQRTHSFLTRFYGPLYPVAVLVSLAIILLAQLTGHAQVSFAAISVVEFTQARRQYFTYIAREDAASYQLGYSYFGWLAQMGGAPDLQVVPFTYLTGTDKVIADAACKLYVILLKKNTTTTAYFKGSDSASASSSTAPEIEFRQTAVEVDQMFFPKGLAMANGFTISSDTTSDGNTGSSAGDGAAGVVVLGRP